MPVFPPADAHDKGIIIFDLIIYYLI